MISSFELCFTINFMSGPVFYNALLGINTNCYDLCNVRQPVVYSIEGVAKWGATHDITVLPVLQHGCQRHNMIQSTEWISNRKFNCDLVYVT